MLLFLFRVGLVCYAVAFIRSLSTVLYLRREGYIRKRNKSLLEGILGFIRALIIFQVPIFNFIMALIMLFISDEKLAQVSIDDGSWIRKENLQ